MLLKLRLLLSSITIAGLCFLALNSIYFLSLFSQKTTKDWNFRLTHGNYSLDHKLVGIDIADPRSVGLMVLICFICLMLFYKKYKIVIDG